MGAMLSIKGRDPERASDQVAPTLTLWPREKVLKRLFV